MPGYMKKSGCFKHLFSRAFVFQDFPRQLHFTIQDNDSIFSLTLGCTAYESIIDEIPEGSVSNEILGSHDVYTNGFYFYVGCSLNKN